MLAPLSHGITALMRHPTNVPLHIHRVSSCHLSPDRVFQLIFCSFRVSSLEDRKHPNVNGHVHPQIRRVRPGALLYIAATRTCRWWRARLVRETGGLRIRHVREETCESTS
jgi:hypothetical protein